MLIFSLLLALSMPQELVPVPRRPLTEPTNPLSQEYLDVASRLVGRALLCNRGYDRLAVMCDEIGPRLSGSEGADRAVEWCFETMQSDGFANVTKQPCMVPVWQRGHCEVNVISPRASELVACALGGSVGTPDGPVRGSIIEVGSFEHLAELGDEVAGKIVFYNHEMKPSTPTFSDYGNKVGMRTQGALEAAKHGAIGSITRSVGTDQSRLPHTGAMRYDNRFPKIPAVAIASEDADHLHRLLARGETVEVSIDLGCQTLPDRESANVLAEIVGREKPEEIIVIGGHLDSWDLGTGAIDDGAGCIIAWEAARLMLELGLQPRRTIRVVLFMNEENGLRGGHSYAETVEDQVKNHVAAIESDMGAGAPLGFRCGAPKAAVEVAEQIAELLQGIGAGAIRPGGSGGADISPLHWRGVPCFGLHQDMTYYFHYHHTPADTVDKVDPHDLSLNIATLAVMAYVLADMEPAFHQLGGEDR